jgi:putative hydrolase of the HAD superfamily
MKLQAVIFDLFGTLVDDFAISVGEMNTELASVLEVPLELLMHHWRQMSNMRTIGAFQTVEASIKYVCAAMGTRLTAQQMVKAVEIRLQHTRRALEPRPNSVATVARVKKQGFKVGLLSNCSIEIPTLWPDTAFADLIENPIFSSRERLKKPDPRIYHLACERLGVTPQQCLYIADGENFELTAAAKAGLHAVLIRNSAQDVSRGLHREAREWQGVAIVGLPEVLPLIAGK